MGPAKIFVGLFEHEEVNADSLVKFSDTCSEFEQTVARAENYLLSAPNNQRNSVLQFVNTVRNFNQNNRKTFNKIIWMTRAAFYLCSNCMDCEKNIQSKGSRISRVVILSSSMPPCWISGLPSKSSKRRMVTRYLVWMESLCRCSTNGNKTGRVSIEEEVRPSVDSSSSYTRQTNEQTPCKDEILQRRGRPMCGTVNGDTIWRR